MKNSMLSFFICFALIACGPSAAEIALREQVKADSIAATAKEELLRQQAEAERQASLKQRLRQLKAQLAGEEARLESIEGFKLLRTESEKEQQIAGQTLVIEEIKAQIEEVNTQINN